MNNWILSTQTGGNITRKWLGRDQEFSLWLVLLKGDVGILMSNTQYQFICFQFLFWLPPTQKVYVDNFCVSMWWKDLQNHISYISLQSNRPCKNIYSCERQETLEWKERRALSSFYFLKFVSSLYPALMSANSKIMIRHIEQPGQDCEHITD